MWQSLPLRWFLQDGKGRSARKGRSRREDSDDDGPGSRRKQAKGSKKAAKGGNEDEAAKGNPVVVFLLSGTLEITAGQSDKL